MNHHEFIHRNVKAILQKEGYPIFVASSAADRAVREYNLLHGSKSRKKSIFDDCLKLARQYAKLRNKVVN